MGSHWVELTGKLFIGAQLGAPFYPSPQELQQPPEDQEAILWVGGGEWSKT